MGTSLPISSRQRFVASSNERLSRADVPVEAGPVFRPQQQLLDQVDEIVDEEQVADLLAGPSIADVLKGPAEVVGSEPSA
jgi:hypothetical protein